MSKTEVLISSFHSLFFWLLASQLMTLLWTQRLRLQTFYCMQFISPARSTLQRYQTSSISYCFCSPNSHFSYLDNHDSLLTPLLLLLLSPDIHFLALYSHWEYKFDYIIFCFKTLQWLSTKLRIKFKILITSYDIQ